jgi:hypothetical protein
MGWRSVRSSRSFQLVCGQIAKENGEVEDEGSEEKPWRHPINAIDSDDEDYDPDPHTCLDPKRYLSPLKCLRNFPCLTQWRIMTLAIRRTFASGTGEMFVVDVSCFLLLILSSCVCRGCSVDPRRQAKSCCVHDVSGRLCGEEERVDRGG